MLKRASLLKLVIKRWLNDSSSKLQILQLFKQKSEHVDFIINILKSFQDVTKHLSTLSQVIIHKI
jgi:hypothetical protein